MYQTANADNIITYRQSWNYENTPIPFFSGNKKSNRRTTTDKNAPNMLTIREVATRTGLSESYIRKLCKTDKITYKKAGVKYLINYDRFIDYLNGTL